MKLEDKENPHTTAILFFNILWIKNLKKGLKVYSNGYQELFPLG
jgi:hypothetical protein